MEKIREHTAIHWCMTSLNAGWADRSDDFTIIKLDDSETETTIEEFLTEALMPFASAVSQVAENEWKEAWETMGAESGYAEYVPTPAEKFNWQDVETMAHHLGIGSQILLEFLANDVCGIHDFSVEWEDETDAHCRTFLLVSPD